jgi:REP-associated tyrosine transposase
MEMGAMGKRSLPVCVRPGTETDRIRSMHHRHVRKTRRTFNLTNHSHELTFSCQHRWPLLSKDRTRAWFLDALDRARQRWEFDIWAYVIMPEHAHVLLYPRRPTYRIAGILKGIKQPVARRAIDYLRREAPQWLERLEVKRPTGKIEHRFWQQGGGYDRNIESAETAWAVVEYIHLNPVRRGLVESPIDWPWSSAAWYHGRSDVKLAMDARPPS